MFAIEVIWVFIIGVSLDALIGDPLRMPHIVRWIGSLSEKLEFLIVGKRQRSVALHVVFWAVLIGGICGSYGLIRLGLGLVSPVASVALDCVIVFQCIAFRDLAGHVRKVQIELDSSLEEARRRVSYIVGRDTERMDESDVCRAAIESGSENLSDAVIAPLFWYVVAGPWGILIYRIANTLDAIVGHRNQRYERFGKFSARVDEVLNFVPARISALFVLGFRRIGEMPGLAPDARKHPSLNAGWPEAAMARFLGVVIGGQCIPKVNW